MKVLRMLLAWLLIHTDRFKAYTNGYYKIYGFRYGNKVYGYVYATSRHMVMKIGEYVELPMYNYDYTERLFFANGEQKPDNFVSYLP